MTSVSQTWPDASDVHTDNDNQFRVSPSQSWVLSMVTTSLWDHKRERAEGLAGPIDVSLSERKCAGRIRYTGAFLYYQTHHQGGSTLHFWQSFPVILDARLWLSKVKALVGRC